MVIPSVLFHIIVSYSPSNKSLTCGFKDKRCRVPLFSSINEISPFQAILWCFYPIGFVVLLELVLRTNDDDDDDEGGGVMSPVYQGT